MATEENPPQGQTCFERIGEGVLVTFANGTVLHFPDRSKALTFANALCQIAYNGADQLDGAEKALLGGEQ